MLNHAGTFAVGRPVCSTDPPVEVLLADGIHVFGVSSVEKESLYRVFSSVFFFHLVSLPEMEYIHNCLMSLSVKSKTLQNNNSIPHFY